MVGTPMPTIRTTTCREVVMQVTYTRPPRGKGGIYRIRLSERHHYGGSTKSFRGRWYEHLRTLKNGTHKNPHMQAVFNQHQRFEPEILEVIPDLAGRILAEQVWLEANFGNPGCVNIQPLAEAPPMEGRTHTEASKAKMSARKKGIPLTPEHCKSLSEAQTRRHQETPMTEETRQKIAQGNRGKKRPYTAERNRQNAGWTHTATAKAKIAEAGQRECSAETRAKISEAHISKGIQPPSFEGRKHTEESRRKMSESSKGPRNMSPEERRRRSEAIHKSWLKRKENL